MAIGRYTALAHTPPEWAAAVVVGRRAPRVSAYLYWNLKKLAKRAGGPAWMRLRGRLLATDRASGTSRHG